MPPMRSRVANVKPWSLPSIRAVVTDDTSNGAKAPVRYHAAARSARSLGYIVNGVVKIDVDVRPSI